MISTLAWIRKGVPSQAPQKYELNDAEYEALVQKFGDEFQLAKEDYEEAAAMEAAAIEKDGEDASMEMDSAGEAEAEDAMDHDDAARGEEPTAIAAVKDAAADDELAEYNLDDYDNEEGGRTDIPLFSSLPGLTYYANPEEDPYITTKPTTIDSDAEDLTVRPTDSLLVVAKTEEEISHLEVYLYEGETGEDNLYVHHDILVSSVPVCMEPIEFQCDASSPSYNYLAVGLLTPTIEIYNLDILDCLMPTVALGPPPSKKKSKKKAPKRNDDYHTDSVLALSHNKLARNMLASGSADQTIKLWNLSTPEKAIRSFHIHKDKVSALTHHPSEKEILLSGGYDKNVFLFDVRAPESSLGVKTMADIECLAFAQDPTCFMVGLETGLIQYYDSRSMTKPLWSLQSADSLTSFSICPTHPSLLMTASADKKVKLWNVQDNKPSLVTSRDLDVGRPFAVQWCADEELVCAVGGSKGKLVVWNVGESADVRRLVGKQGSSSRKEVVEEVDDDVDEQSEEEEEELVGR